MKRRAISIAVLLGLTISFNLAAQWNSPPASPGAAEQLRLGVVAYNQGRIAESILLFEKALAWDPSSASIQFWLGRAYYRLGFESTALKTWQPLLSVPDAPASFRAFDENLGARRALDFDSEPPRYIEAHRYDGRAGTPKFLRPSTLLALPDGSFFVVAQGSAQVLRLDANGATKEKLSGGLEGFDRPFGIARLSDGTLMVSEFNGDRISRISAAATKTFATKGRGDGQVLGPQYVAADDAGYVYVSDYGNARVDKFDSDGKAMLSFGTPSGDFPGFRSPTGLAWIDGVIYVADAAAKSIYSFDESGNFLGTLIDGQLHFPEGLSPWQGGRALLVADSDRIVSVDISNERLDEIYRSPDAKPRITSAVADYMGGVLACDFNASSVSVLNEATDLARGFDVEISRVDASAFPRVRLAVDVRDRLGRPVVGLGASNFYLSETLHSRTTVTEAGKPVLKTTVTIAPVAKLEYLGSGTDSPGFRSIMLVERSRAMSSLGGELGSVIADFGGALGADDLLGFVSAGKSPIIIDKPENRPDLSAIVRSLRKDSDSTGRFDLGLRSAVDALMPTGSRDSIVYVGTGTLDEGSVKNESVSELASLLANNGISFHVVLLGNGSPDPTLRYLVQRSGGTIVRAEGPRGVTDLPRTLGSAPSGRYEFGFVSADDPDFGNRQMSVSIEAWLFQKSGRDELGYYAPLK